MPARPYKVADQEEQRQKSRAVIGQFVFINHFKLFLKNSYKSPTFKKWIFIPYVNGQENECISEYTNELVNTVDP